MKSNVPDFRGDASRRHQVSRRTLILSLSLILGCLIIVLTLLRQDASRTASYASSAAAIHLGVYAGSGDGSLYKLDASNGSQEWRFQTQGRTIPAPATVTNGVAYFGSSDSNVYALNATNGAKLWRFSTNGPVLASPAVDNSVVYIGSSDGNIYALNATSGTKLWSYYAGQPNEAVTPTTVVVDQGVVYGSSSDSVIHSYLFALDAGTGAQLWRIQINDQLFTSPQVVNGVIYIASSALSQQGRPTVTDSYVYAYNTKDGSLLWRSTKVSDMILDTPAVVNGVVYFGSKNANVYALTASDGTEIWHHNAGGAVMARPQVDSGIVYVGTTGGGTSNNFILALNAKDGSQRWQHAITNYAGANLIVNGSVLYVGASDSVIYALKTTDGSQIWNHKDTAPFTNAPLTVAP